MGVEQQVYNLLLTSLSDPVIRRSSIFHLRSVENTKVADVLSAYTDDDDMEVKDNSLFCMMVNQRVGFIPKVLKLSEDLGAGEDWDDDGSPDGDYQGATYSIDDADSSGYDAWSGLVEWGGVSESDGTYTASQTIKYDEDFEMDSVYFWLWDNDSYGKDGAK
jgi:hypothetical protein